VASKLAIGLVASLDDDSSASAAGAGVASGCAASGVASGCAGAGSGVGSTGAGVGSGVDSTGAGAAGAAMKTLASPQKGQNLAFSEGNFCVEGGYEML